MAALRGAFVALEMIVQHVFREPLHEGARLVGGHGRLRRGFLNPRAAVDICREQATGERRCDENAGEKFHRLDNPLTTNPLSSQKARQKD
ncbi:MAG TPA: hypothetical protein VK961_23755 [Chthoniobacter sp.]|nr:hypothetical protein [Chthoniobacter sp.]